eukprot:1368025-Amorphochlora_amoeboformis.AAC.1
MCIRDSLKQILTRAQISLHNLPPNGPHQPPPVLPLSPVSLRLHQSPVNLQILPQRLEDPFHVPRGPCWRCIPGHRVLLLDSRDTGDQSARAVP